MPLKTGPRDVVHAFTADQFLPDLDSLVTRIGEARGENAAIAVEEVDEVRPPPISALPAAEPMQAGR
jgi:hypothetical protein